MPRLAGFNPVEMCNLDYSSSRGSAIDPHKDDEWLWGNHLVTVNLLSSTILTFTCPCVSAEIQVPLPRRSLIAVYSSARYTWLHSIKHEHISGHRIAVTFRELSKEFSSGGTEADVGKELLAVANSFSGTPISNPERSVHNYF